ncbi:MAG TPA: ABC transporter permease [Mycobacteriales bacterium]|jgi:ABC-type transport system involved in multi-copper enzyme maturation permease subunit|nr:ABC transporter permease [Mycobacteriales bacterium]
MMPLVRSELRKVLTTNTWWLMLLGVVGFTAIASAFSLFFVNEALKDPELGASLGIGSDGAGLASYTYTSGQFFGTLFVMLLGALMVTNEFQHQTATPTFLATPRRVRVIGSKLITAVGLGAAFGLVQMLISVPVGAVFLSMKAVDTHLGDPTVLAALALNLLAYAVWTVFGVGIGTLLRNQIAAIVVCVVLKVVAEQILSLVLMLLSRVAGDWVMDLAWALPSQASTVMTSATRLPDAPPWYVGAAILLAYGLVTAGVGAAITRRRDIT